MATDRNLTVKLSATIDPFFKPLTLAQRIYSRVHQGIRIGDRHIFNFAWLTEYAGPGRIAAFRFPLLRWRRLPVASVRKGARVHGRNPRALGAPGQVSRQP